MDDFAAPEAKDTELVDFENLKLDDEDFSEDTKADKDEDFGPIEDYDPTEPISPTEAEKKQKTEKDTALEIMRQFKKYSAEIKTFVATTSSKDNFKKLLVLSKEIKEYIRKAAWLLTKQNIALRLEADALLKELKDAEHLRDTQYARVLTNKEWLDRILSAPPFH
jgi:hypothetical protein